MDGYIIGTLPNFDVKLCDTGFSGMIQYLFSYKVDCPIPFFIAVSCRRECVVYHDKNLCVPFMTTFLHALRKPCPFDLVRKEIFHSPVNLLIGGRMQSGGFLLKGFTC